MSSTNNKIKETSNIEILLEKTIILIGYYARGSAERQQSLHYGSHPTPLQKLCNLPFKFFSLDSNKEILFPTLISICYNDIRNRNVIEDEISTQMLSEFIKERTEEETSNTFRTRFPKQMWNDAITCYFFCTRNDAMGKRSGNTQKRPAAVKKFIWSNGS